MAKRENNIEIEKLAPGSEKGNRRRGLGKVVGLLIEMKKAATYLIRENWKGEN